MDAFISHSSSDLPRAEEVERALRAGRLTVWLDRSAIVPGRLLRAELQHAIDDCRALVLVWSKRAALSRWVSAELLTAFHLDRAILACVLEDTPLPYFLQNALFIEVRKGKTNWPEVLRRGVREAPAAAEQVPKRSSYQPPDARMTFARLASGQREMLECLRRGHLVEARKRQRRMDVPVRAAARKWRFEADALNLLGYHYKNAYMLRHWTAVQADQPPKDPLLEKAERYFFKTLFVDPNEYSALNGIGNVLLFRRDFEAAEFFIRRAIARAELAGFNYREARNDLDIVLAHKEAGGPRIGASGRTSPPERANRPSGRARTIGPA